MIGLFGTATVRAYREVVVHDEVEALSRFPLRIRGKPNRAEEETRGVRFGI